MLKANPNGKLRMLDDNNINVASSVVTGAPLRGRTEQGSHAHAGAGSVWNSIPSSQFSCEPKTSLKKQVYLQIKNKTAPPKNPKQKPTSYSGGIKVS